MTPEPVPAANDLAAPVLIALAGLPGTGKTTLSGRVAARLGATFLRIDAFEAGLVRAGLEFGSERGPAGYIIAAAVAHSCLLRGLPVVVDAVNPVKESRDGWQQLADETGVPVLFVEVVCSDPAVHEARVTGRSTDTPELPDSTWQQVRERHYEQWDRPRLVIDNLGPLEQHVDRVVQAVTSLPR